MTEQPGETDRDEANAAEADSGAAANTDVAALQEEVASLKDRLLRAVAETDNVRKRAERERDAAAKYGIAGFARDIVAVADNFARALKAVPEAARQDEAVRTLIDGVEMIERELQQALERHGVKRIDPKHTPFDPNFHQAVAEIPAGDLAPGTVAEVIQAGYVIDDRLIRPAMVVVAGAAKSAKPEPGANLDTSA
jgi:molecular chaperone GrpE